jgi:hypothetical protein
MKKRIAAGLFLFVLVANACSGFVQPSPTAIPAFTPTGVPISTATFVSTSTAPLLIETPGAASEWKGIPIMPDALTREGDEEGYVFTIQATPQEVQEYYQLELEKLGWQAFGTDEGDSSLMLIFINDASEVLTVSVIAKGDEVLVLLAK